MNPAPASPPPEHRHTAPEDRIPLAGKLGYASGGMAVNLMANGIVTLASFVLNIKLGVSAAFVLSGILLNLTGFSAALGGAQSGNTIFLMRLFDAGIPALAVAGAILLTLLYPISEARSYEIRDELEKRRGRRSA